MGPKCADAMHFPSRKTHEQVLNDQRIARHTADPEYDDETLNHADHNDQHETFQTHAQGRVQKH
jgi:hypothetical protein